MLGTIPGWLTLLGLAVVGWYVARGSGGQALSILRESNEVLGRRVQELDRQLKTAQQNVAHLETQRSLEPIVAAVVDQFVQHEQRATERHLKLLEIADEIAARVHRERVADAREGR